MWKKLLNQITSTTSGISETPLAPAQEKTVYTAGGFTQSSNITGDPTDYSKYYNGWVYANLNALASSVSKMEIKLYKVRVINGTTELIEVENHEVLDKLDRLNAFTSYTDALYITQTYKDMAGDCFWYIDDARQNIYILEPNKVKVLFDYVGGGGVNAVNRMIESGLRGVEFIAVNTDAQALLMSDADVKLDIGRDLTRGLGAGADPDKGRQAADDHSDEIEEVLKGADMVFVTAGEGGGTGTGAAPVIAKAARDMGILTVGVVTKPFAFEGTRRAKSAEAGIEELQKFVDTLIVIPNQNLFRVANEKTTFADAFAMADQVLYSGVACITDLMVKEGLINLDFADVRAVMREMGKAMMGCGEASGDHRASQAAEAAIANPLLDDVSIKGARGLLVRLLAAMI